MTRTSTAGAYQHWDQQWRRTEGITTWAQPDPDVTALGGKVLAAGGRRCLDVGCGIGRHALALADLGFEAHAIDRSEAGLARVAAEAARRKVDVTTRMADMTSLPYPDGSFDFDVAWNVIYHGTLADAATAAAEITRILRLGGQYLTHGTSGSRCEIPPSVVVGPAAPEQRQIKVVVSRIADSGNVQT
jgi:ubiquinone/menaquinone biosynthesis C-methylase UbiE